MMCAKCIPYYMNTAIPASPRPNGWANKEK